MDEGKLNQVNSIRKLIAQKDEVQKQLAQFSTQRGELEIELQSERRKIEQIRVDHQKSICDILDLYTRQTNELKETQERLEDAQSIFKSI